MPRGVRSANADVRAIRRALHTLVDALVRLLENTQSALPRPSAPATGSKRTLSAQARPPRPRAPLSRARRAGLKLQGEYIGRLRGLTAADQVRVKALRAKKGFPAAIKLATRLAS